MTEGLYKQFYTASDTFVYLEHRETGSQIHIDTLSSIGWNESLSAGPIYSLGNQLSEFYNEGNIFVAGVISLVFTDEKYLQLIFKELTKEHLPNKEDSIFAFKYGTLMAASEARISFDKSVKEESEDRNMSSIGIHTFPRFNIRGCFDNTSLFNKDITKMFYINDCKITGRQIMSATGADGRPVTEEYSFIGKYVES